MNVSSAFSTTVRALILARDDGRCVWCGRPWGDRLNVHHRRLRSQGGSGEAANGISVCGSGTTGCHGAIHAHPARAAERGHIVRSGDAPTEVPVLSWRGLIILNDAGGWSPADVAQAGSNGTVAGLGWSVGMDYPVGWAQGVRGPFDGSGRLWPSVPWRVQ